MALLAAGGSVAGDAERIDRHLASLRATLDPRAAAALESIDGTGRRLLAARSYLRSERQLADRWSWTPAEAAAFEQSPAKALLDAAVERVRCEFEKSNPGHSLFVNPSLRTLDVQIEHWNHNASVGHAADHLLAALRAALAAPGLPDPARPEGRNAFRRWLIEHKPEPAPTIAAPGLSLHGRMHAIDFQVEAAGRIVAGPSTAAIPSDWDQPGWTARLQAAVAAADAGFVGPLKDPYEPWHYDFRPPAGAADVLGAAVPYNDRVKASREIHRVRCTGTAGLGP